MAGADHAVSRASPEELQLIARVLAGEKEVFYELIRPCERSLFHIALAILHNPQDAEDTVQDAVLKAFRRLDTFRGDARFYTWLMRITTNEAKMRLRRQLHIRYQPLEPAGENGDYCPLLLGDWTEIPSEVLERQEVRNEIKRALGELPEKYRSVLLLRDIEQLNIA